jgi:hypothetical protein
MQASSAEFMATSPDNRGGFGQARR